MGGGFTDFRAVEQYTNVVWCGMTSTECQAMAHGLDAERMAVLAKLNALLHVIVRLMSARLTHRIIEDAVGPGMHIRQHHERSTGGNKRRAGRKKCSSVYRVDG